MKRPLCPFLCGTIHVIFADLFCEKVKDPIVIESTNYHFFKYREDTVDNTSMNPSFFGKKKTFKSLSPTLNLVEHALRNAKSDKKIQ